MEQNPLEQRATPGRLRTLAQGGHLDAKTLETSLRMAGSIPNGKAWEKFIGHALLLLGAAFTLSGVFFFFAYNWADMHRFFKFGLIETAILFAAGLAFYKGLDNLSGKIALAAAAILVGALLAVYGQTYQTGADSYQLFLTWALLIAGWVAIGSYAPLWFVLLVLLNTSLILYWNQVIGYRYEAVICEMLFLLNAGALLIWEYASGSGIRWLQSRWMPRLIALVTFVSLVIPTLLLIFSFGYWEDKFLILAPVLYIGFSLFTLYFYSQKTRDLFILTICALSMIIVITSTVIDLLHFDGGGDFLLLGLLIIGQAALALNGLRKLAKSLEDSDD
ncbi:MAG: DUF2157 domain-containing protein [Chloroflexi bacterium]|nr:DUF2157 domain-containing protein [Chloroflexota bacterium]